jgi:hypothetical protein
MTNFNAHGVFFNVRYLSIGGCRSLFVDPLVPVLDVARDAEQRCPHVPADQRRDVDLRLRPDISSRVRVPLGTRVNFDSLAKCTGYNFIGLLSFSKYSIGSMVS